VIISTPTPKICPLRLLLAVDKTPEAAKSL
jgi:hypothetical protein